jgi:hypothetical protein
VSFLRIHIFQSIVEEDADEGDDAVEDVPQKAKGRDEASGMQTRKRSVKAKN